MSKKRQQINELVPSDYIGRDCIFRISKAAAIEWVRLDGCGL